MEHLIQSFVATGMVYSALASRGAMIAMIASSANTRTSGIRERLLSGEEPGTSADIVAGGRRRGKTGSKSSLSDG